MPTADTAASTALHHAPPRRTAPWGHDHDHDGDPSTGRFIDTPRTEETAHDRFRRPVRVR
ncbi:hypothetical protein [Streptomyces spinosisporus]|uniref:Uncharacterized protein n=1 Tax=Streptomyces spinosisporus TaxID=2927582 RepID=A0ABS9XUK7_9ACTN|nr:hypothetical protein [Streptomyces spinosisporus]MCI3245735.1 hypothetical protein [Streptomyces spinosisporus]